MLSSGHTPDWTSPTVERVMSNGKRIFVLAFRRWLVEQARQPSASVAGLGLRHGINANQLCRWMLVDHKLVILPPYFRTRSIRDVAPVQTEQGAVEQHDAA
jgi:hypothetical protein